MRQFVIFFEGSVETLKQHVTKCKGMTVVELGEENYDFLYNSVIEEATRQAAQ
jgi:hypothetical protein